ncbi:MAG: hypothetical protein AAF702_22300 [Chloroflexota bacterium]
MSEKKNFLSLQRKDLFELAVYCRKYAGELAEQDPSRVSLKHCYEFNSWLPKVRSYDRLAPALSDIKLARPITRWQIMSILALLGLVGFLFVSSYGSRSIRTLWLYGYPLFLICAYILPERLYGTTIELVEAKVLLVIDELERLLFSDEMDLSEAAFFHIKEDLKAARQELREQLDQAYRTRLNRFH